MLASFIGGTAIFAGLTFGLAWPVASRLALDPAEKLVASVVLSVLGVYLGAWLVFVASLPPRTLWLLPLFAGVGLMMGRRDLAAIARDRDVRALVGGQALVASWCLGWLALVASYSGGGWAGDWFEHWERARFFVEHWPRDHLFIGYAPLTARPPLANVVTGAFLVLTRVDFPLYQVFSTLLGSVVFLPAALLTRRFGGSRSIGTAAACLMVNPLFVQNATFPWTKLPAAFFVLSGLYFFLQASSSARPLTAAVLCSAALAAGILAHYSAGPHVVLLAIAWLLLFARRDTGRVWRNATIPAVLVGAGVLGTWFGWSIARMGLPATLLTNTSVVTAEADPGSQLVRIVLNIRDTLVPHVLRAVDPALIAQTSPWGRLRDGWFQLYQLNLFLAFGCTGWLALVALTARAAGDRNVAATTRAGWGIFVAAAILFGIAVHGARDTWGLAHICLQPLVLLGLALLAARWHSIPPLGRRALIAGATVDVVLGIALHFAVQNFAFERWAGPSAIVQWEADSSPAAVMNLAAKLGHRLRFVSDVLPVPTAAIGVGLLGVLVTALWRAHRAEAEGDVPRSALEFKATQASGRR